VFWWCAWSISHGSGFAPTFSAATSRSSTNARNQPSLTTSRNLYTFVLFSGSGGAIVASRPFCRIAVCILYFFRS
jgi:hypothetical protein